MLIGTDMRFGDSVSVEGRRSPGSKGANVDRLCPFGDDVLATDGYREFMAGDWEGRHGTQEARERFGVWRWAGVYHMRAEIVASLPKARWTVCDFGGALGPLGLQTRVCDVLGKDIWGREVACSRFDEWPHLLRAFWSSHALEHLTDEEFQEVVPMAVERLPRGGHFMANVPSVRGAFVWAPTVRDVHHRIFTAEGLPDVVNVGQVVGLDSYLSSLGMKIEHIHDDQRDNSLVIIARKP
jgi:hypothetical protein